MEKNKQIMAMINTNALATKAKINPNICLDNNIIELSFHQKGKILK